MRIIRHLKYFGSYKFAQPTRDATRLNCYFFHAISTINYNYLYTTVVPQKVHLVYSFTQSTKAHMLRINRGILISVEGIDGSGKTTVAHTLASHFKQLSLPTLLTREPGATSLGKQLRTLVQEKIYPLCSKAEFLIFAADRAQHFHELVLPALASNTLVISDRMADSSLAYQGFGRGLDLEMLNRINSFVMNNRTPDITLYVRVPVDIAFNRILARNEKLSSFEQEKKDFMHAVAQGFDTISQNRENCYIVDGQQSSEQVSLQAIKLVESWMHNNHILI